MGNQNSRLNTAAETRFLRSAVYIFLNHKGSETEIKELNILLASKYLRGYSQKWLDHVNQNDTQIKEINFFPASKLMNTGRIASQC